MGEENCGKSNLLNNIYNTRFPEAKHEFFQDDVDINFTCSQLTI
jgi:hypothetical protein